MRCCVAMAKLVSLMIDLGALLVQNKLNVHWMCWALCWKGRHDVRRSQWIFIDFVLFFSTCCASTFMSVDEHWAGRTISEIFACHLDDSQLYGWTMNRACYNLWLPINTPYRKILNSMMRKLAARLWQGNRNAGEIRETWIQPRRKGRRNYSGKHSDFPTMNKMEIEEGVKSTCRWRWCASGCGSMAFLLLSSLTTDKRGKVKCAVFALCFRTH